MSVDLAGSTAFKNGIGKEPVTGDESRPRWVQRIRHFYRKFPALVRERYAKFCVSEDAQAVADYPPKVWKTIGDEIIMCCRILHLEHLAVCTHAFLQALQDYGLVLDSTEGFHLDIKGAGWVAAFPTPNITVAVDESLGQTEHFGEEFELAADNNPANVDFLGNGIDCGFRVASKATTDRFVVSVELAWLLSEACHQKKFNHTFRYHSREVLRGVIKDRPYPIVSIDTERSATRREVLEAERTLRGTRNPDVTNIRNFVHSFMRDEGIERPVLPRHGQKAAAELPPSYQRFAEAWKVAAAGIQTQNAEQEAAENADGSGNADMPTAITNAFDALLAEVEGGRAKGRKRRKNKK